MSRYRLERDGGFLRVPEIDKWWSLGSFPDLISIVQFMEVYDPEGTIRMRVLDIYRDQEVRQEVVAVMRCRLEVRLRSDPKLDWKVYGF